MRSDEHQMCADECSRAVWEYPGARPLYSVRASWTFVESALSLGFLPRIEVQ